uniref:p53 and DNA damage-regulated protein 1-like n=1 Tax=Phallusia mammillata TaxID=59560 RepID=A0A6F9DNJ8_9ASCI|nr:p53 and DNA damage-regulated protein 1-like [Phallusia mammillata]
MARSVDFVLNYLQELEELAEDVLTDKQTIVDLNKRYNANRMALTAINKKVTAPPGSADKAWVNFGGMFIKVSKESTKAMLAEDQKELENNIKDLRTKLPAKVNKLRDAEGKEELKGFNLAPIDAADMKKLKI